MDEHEVEEAIKSAFRSLSLEISLDKGGMSSQSLNVKLMYQGDGMIYPEEIASDSISVMELKSVLGSW